MKFSFRAFGYSPIIFLLLTSSCSSITAREYTLYYFSSFQCVACDLAMPFILMCSHPCASGPWEASSFRESANDFPVSTPVICKPTNLKPDHHHCQSLTSQTPAAVAQMPGPRLMTAPACWPCLFFRQHLKGLVLRVFHLLPD